MACITSVSQHGRRTRCGSKIPALRWSETATWAGSSYRHMRDRTQMPPPLYLRIRITLLLSCSPLRYQSFCSGTEMAKFPRCQRTSAVASAVGRKAALRASVRSVAVRKSRYHFCMPFVKLRYAQCACWATAERNPATPEFL